MRIHLALLPMAVLVGLVGTNRASAQVVIDGPRWRIVIGEPAGLSDKLDSGWSNIPGSNGFVPGYGYYPDYSSNWPTLREAIQNNPRRQRGQPRVETTPIDAGPSGCAVIEVLVPADAEVSFFGNQAAQKGTVRQFVTPPLVVGRSYYYDMQVRSQENGCEVVQTRSIPVRADERQTVDFRAPELRATGVSK